MSIDSLPKADMHVHLEATMTPDLMRKITARNGIPVPPRLMSSAGEHFRWEGDEDATKKPVEALMSFLQAYDDVTLTMRTPQDYTDLTYDYLKRAAAEGCIYSELTISADHGKLVGVEYPDMCNAIAKGYEQAKAETGIEARLISTFVRQPVFKDSAETPEQRAVAVGKLTHDFPHPLVTGLGLAGAEMMGTFAGFLPAYEAAGPLQRTAHAGEAMGPQSVRDAMNVLGIRRFGHMVRAMEDAELVRDLKAINAVPEVCVSSNIYMRVFNDYAAHPLRRMFDAGFKVVLGSDDPSFFKTSIGNEYKIAHEKFGFTEKELLRVTQNAVEEAFVDAPTRARLMARVRAFTPAP